MAQADNDQQLQLVVFEFVRAFARMEYALLNADCVENGQTNWTAAITKLDVFPGSDSLDRLKKLSPRRAIFRRGGFRFTEPALGETAASQAVALLRVIRNNLFHGGKMDQSGWDDEKRLIQLLPPATQLIHDLTKVDRDIAAHFHDEV